MLGLREGKSWLASLFLDRWPPPLPAVANDTGYGHATVPVNRLSGTFVGDGVTWRVSNRVGAIDMLAVYSDDGNTSVGGGGESTV